MLNNRNAYTCDVCDRDVVTLDKDAGTTPMMIPCVVTPNCPGAMHSHFYSGPRVVSNTPATYEFRRPSREEYDLLSPAMQSHIDAGGLELYPLRAH